MYNIKDLFDRIYIINLNRRVDRLRSTMREIGKIGLSPDDVTIYDGIDGKKMKLIATNKPKFTNGMVGCFLTHTSIYKECVNNKFNRVLILEDDIKIDDDFLEKIKELNHIGFLESKSYSMMYLGWYFGNDNHNYKESGENGFIIPQDFFGFHSYIINGADTFKKLIKMVEVIEMQVDNQIIKKTRDLENFITLNVYPQLINQNGSRTDIQTNKI